MSRHHVAFARAFVVALLAASFAGAQSPPPLAVEHLPPVAHPSPSPHRSRMERPGMGLDRDMILRRHNIQHRPAEMLLQEARELAVVGPPNL